MDLTAYDLAQRYVGMALERPGPADNHPLIVWWLSLCGLGNATDETAWCSAFVNGIAWELRLPRSKSAAARSWLSVGKPINLSDATPGYDVVILNRNGPTDPSQAGPGHVGFFAGLEVDRVLLLAGNQGNNVSVARFPYDQVLGVRRLS